MRLRRPQWFLLGSAFALCGIWVLMAALGRTAPGDVRVNIIGYTLTNNVLRVSAVAVNKGDSILVWSGDPPPADISWDSGDAINLTTPKIHSKSSFGFLQPGASNVYNFSIPGNARRVRVICQFETLGLRGRLFCKLPRTGWIAPSRSALEVLFNVIPEQRDSAVFWSEEILTNDVPR